MRQVIRRFLKHLEAEKNASVTTIESYQYDLHKFDAYLVKRLGNKFLPGDVSRTTFGIISYGWQRWVIKSQTVHRLVRGPWPRYGRFSNMLIEQGC
jgi:site-specific recombinase XerC